MSNVIRVFVEKREGFDVEARHMLADLRDNLGLTKLTGLRLLVRYDIEGLSAEEFIRARGVVFSEPNADDVYDEEFTVAEGWRVFAMEYLPGQYDQRADSAAQCVQLTRSTLFEEAYVDPRSITLTFPEEKRNLVYIYLESMESTYLSKELGGNQEENLLPNLSELALANLNFSHTDTLGGARQVTGTSWTIAAMVSQTTGVPLKIPVGDNDYGNKSARFLPGVWSLGDILEQEGYRQELLIGSDASFGGRRQYFAQHGGYDIWDYYTARETGKIDPDYRVWWGYEDLKLFDYAREELTALAAEGEPFNFTMLTVDTHFPSGYVCPACWQDDERQYANVISCSDRLVADFVWWIQQQDFYENTTIILVGDHLSMDSRFFVDNGEYVRTTFNTIINAPMDTAFDKERMFTTLDWFPTTLASLGVEIPGERLGLGTNLFSGQPTLAESMGLEALDDGFKLLQQAFPVWLGWAITRGL